MSTRTKKLIVSPTQIKKRVSFSSGGSNINSTINNEFRNEQEFLRQQNQELRNLHDNQLFELQELQEQQINEIEELTRNRANARLKSLYKVLITLLVASIIYGVYTNQFQPQPVEPFHSNEPIGRPILDSIKEKTGNWYNLWSDSFKELARISPLPESKTMPAGHSLHEKQILEKTLRYQKEKELKQQQLNKKEMENLIKQRSNFRPSTNYVDQDNLLKEIQRQLTPHPGAPPTSINNPIPPVQQPSDSIFIKDELSNIKDNFEQQYYKFQAVSKEFLHDLQDKKDYLKDTILGEPHGLKHEFDQLVNEIKKSNYHIFKDMDIDNIGEPTLEKLIELKYKLKDAARLSRESFKQQIENAKSIEQELLNLKQQQIENDKQNTFHPKNQIDENLIIV